jgi:hypothetical protein
VDSSTPSAPSSGPSVHRRFWCPLVRREVEVEFATRGWLGLRRPAAVRRCSVFNPSEAVHCDRRCVEASFRKQWDVALPARSRP